MDLRDEVDQPNQGIIDWAETDIIVAAGGVVVGLIFGLMIGLPCYFGIGIQGLDRQLRERRAEFLVQWAGIWSGYWCDLGPDLWPNLGGSCLDTPLPDWLLLVLDHQKIPWRLEEFLTYATKMNLLRRVGGGFEFIDQDLQAYFEKAARLTP